MTTKIDNKLTNHTQLHQPMETVILPELIIKPEIPKSAPAATYINGSQALMRALVAEGVDTIFGYPGGAIMPVYDALYDFQDRINHILVRHEQGAAHAAEGYARVTGRAGVCLVTSGPGATNLVTGIADALIDSTPMVCIVGQVGKKLGARLLHRRAGRPRQQIGRAHV